MNRDDLTYLDQCSIAAMSGMLDADPLPMLHTELAAQAWLIARAMLAERNKVVHGSVAEILQAGLDNKGFKGPGKKKPIETSGEGGC